MVSSGIPSLDELLGGGYPERSAVLVTGPAGIGKEALGYHFIHSGLLKGEFCLYVTRLSLRDVLHDQRAFGIASTEKTPMWIARGGGQVELDMGSLPKLAGTIKELVERNKGRKVRIVTDILSSVLMLNPAEAVYRFADELVVALKEYDAVMLASLEDGMHPPSTQAAMLQLFDGVVEFSFQKTGLRLLSMVRVLKMRGAAPRQEYYTFSLADSGMHLRRAEERLQPGKTTPVEEPVQLSGGGPAPAPLFASQEARGVFDYLLRSFLTDYRSDRLSIEQSGWRTRVAISESTGIGMESFYGKGGKDGPVLRELISTGLVESRLFYGQRGRGGEVTKVRVSYEKELVKRLLERASRGEGEQS